MLQVILAFYKKRFYLLQYYLQCNNILYWLVIKKYLVLHRLLHVH